VAQYQNVIKSLSQSNGKTAVLFRNNETAVALICMLDAIGYNGYSFKGADASFFTDRFVTDVLNILRFANNPYDTLLFEEICYKTIFKIKKNVVASLCKEASDNDLDIFEAIEESPYITQSHKKFFRAKKNDFLKLAHMKVSDAINEILYTFDYFKYLSHRRDINAQRVVNSKLCTLQVIGKYDRDFISFEDRLEHLQNIISTGSKNKNSQIILSTIHSSKGLEYDNVYIVDAVDDVLPSVVKDNKMSDSDKEIYLEERRLFYVAMTRAKKYLCMYEIDTRCSSFVDEVKEMLTPKEKKTEIAHNPNMFYRGNKVHHKKFGNGTVVNVDKDLITVKFNFGAYGQKIISKDYLTKL
jgi:DNA helicase-2/ATP-dependent DNA helicase PcrA